MNSAAPNIRRILVISTSHIGSVLLNTLAFPLLRRFFPGSEISILVRRGVEPILENNPFLKRIYISGDITSNQRMRGRSKNSLVRRLNQIPEGLRLLRELRRERFDLVVDFPVSDRNALLALFSGAPRRACFEPKGGFFGKKWCYTLRCTRMPANTHKVLENAELIRQIAVAEGRLRPEEELGEISLVLNPPAETLAWAEAEWKIISGDHHPRVLLHPASRVFYKCWSPAKWTQVIERARKDFGAHLLLTTGPDPKEMEMAAAVADGCAVKPAVKCGGLTLSQLAALIQKADLFLGVDSAPMHIASAVGTRIVAVFGPSRDDLWGPWGKGHRVVRRPCDCLSLKTRRCSENQGMDCLAAVGVEDVFQAVAESLRASA